MALTLRWPPFLRSRLDRLLRPATPSSPGGATVLGQRDIYIFPTRHGFLFAIVLVAMLLGAMNYSNSLGFILTFLLASLAIVSILHAYHNLADLHIEGVRAEPVFAGQTATFRIVFNNPTAVARNAISLNTEAGINVTVDLAAETLTTVAISVPAPRRGRLALGRLTLESRYPLGLFRAWAYWHPPSTATVYPHPAPPLPLPVGTGDGGPWRDAPERGTDDFRGFRDYHPGDNLRHINWKAAARGQGLQVKQFATNKSEILWLKWEQTEAPSVEARLSQLCRWVLEAQRLGLPFGITLPDSELPPALDERHVQRALTRLALFALP